MWAIEFSLSFKFKRLTISELNLFEDNFSLPDQWHSIMIHMRLERLRVEGFPKNMFNAFKSKSVNSPTIPTDESDSDNLYSFDKTAAGSYNRLTTGDAFAPRTGRVPTASNQGGEGGRPMTSVRAAGYSSKGKPGGYTSAQSFDPFNQAGRITPEKPSTADSAPEDIIKGLEKKVAILIEESTFAAAQGDFQLALDKAKDAGKKERQLSKQREQLNLGDQHNLDLTYSVLFNLANQYHVNNMYTEALSSYSVIVKNKLFNQSGRLRVNMGNIYFEQGKYPQAVKMYRMALDQISNANRHFRLKIMRNIGNSFIKMGAYQDAITSFEAIMEGSPDYHTGFNLLLCYFAIGDKEKMKRGFQRLVAINASQVEQNDDGTPIFKEEPIEDHEVFNEDNLRAITRERRKTSNRYIILAAKLVAPSIDPNFSDGFDWMIEVLKASPNAHMASELEIAKSVQYLKSKDFQKAIDCLKDFERKDQKLVGTAATNLSFLYYLDNDLKNSEHYANVAIDHDRYNSKAQTNKGNIYFAREQYTKAKEHYLEVLSLDAVCTEAMFNLGLTYKKMNDFDSALTWFEKLNSIIRSSPEVIYQIADIYELQGNQQQALEWLNILISIVPTDPSILGRLGRMFDSFGDKSQAFQYYSESYRYYPSNIAIISWLGAYYVDCEVYEQAIQFFQRASQIQPVEVKWRLMVASCYRKSGNYQVAFETYKSIHEKYPENIECLRFLVRICADLGMTSESKDYETKLDKLDVGSDFIIGDFTGDSREKKLPNQPILPPSFPNFKIPTKQVTPAPFKVDNDLFHENVHDILPD